MDTVTNTSMEDRARVLAAYSYMRRAGCTVDETTFYLNAMAESRDVDPVVAPWLRRYAIMARRRWIAKS